MPIVFHIVNAARKPPKTRYKAFLRSDEQRAVREPRTRLTATARHWRSIYANAPEHPHKFDELPLVGLS